METLPLILLTLCLPLACVAQDDGDTWDFKEEVEIGGSEAQALRSLEVFARRMFEGKKFDTASQVLADAEKQAKGKRTFVVIQCWKAKFLEAQGNVADANALMDNLGERVKDMPAKGNDSWQFDMLTRAMPRGWRNAQLKERGCNLEQASFEFTVKDVTGAKFTVAFDCGDLSNADFPETQHIRLNMERPPPGDFPVKQEFIVPELPQIGGTRSVASPAAAGRARRSVPLQGALIRRVFMKWGSSVIVPTKEGVNLKVESHWGVGQRRPHEGVRIVEPERNRPDGEHAERYTWKTEEGDDLAVIFEFDNAKLRLVRIEHLINFWKPKK